MKRLFWLGVGVAAGVAMSRKVSGVARRATPAGVAANLGDALSELAGAIGAFGADVRAGMVEREHELHEEVQRQTGIAPGRPPAVAAGGSALAGRQGRSDGRTPPPRQDPGRRARRAGG